MRFRSRNSRVNLPTSCSRAERGAGSARRAVRREDLGALLDLTFGAQMAGQPLTGGQVAVQDLSLRRCVPSHRSLRPGHPRQRCRARGVSLLPANVAAASHPKGGHARQAVRYLAGQNWFAGAAVVVFMTALLPRLWRRYSNARSYRAALLEAGHVCQTFCLVATWLGACAILHAWRSTTLESSVISRSTASAKCCCTRQVRARNPPTVAGCSGPATVLFRDTLRPRPSGQAASAAATARALSVQLDDHPIEGVEQIFAVRIRAGGVGA